MLRSIGRGHRSARQVAADSSSARCRPSSGLAGGEWIMSLGTIAGVFILPGAVFALLYFPVMTHLARGLVSPYGKADIAKRLFAATTDGLIVAVSCRLYWNTGATSYLAAGAAYLLFRDAIRGQSLGKLVFGLVVISLETGRPASAAASLRRNALLLLPGANVVAVFLEGAT